ncbi:MAG: hypothetical protein QOG90_2023 [Actinomycetota bacterium]|jgi:hypothetical protein
MAEARRMWAALKLLDRQILDREDRFAGNVDDVILERLDDGTLAVTGLWSGAGGLAHRLGARRFGRWLQRMRTELGDGDGVIALGAVQSIGNHVRVAKDARELTSEASERWVRDHFIGHIPGNDHAAE